MNRSGHSREGVSTPVHNQLEQWIRACSDKTGLKIVVAPSSHAARMIRTALARQGCPLVNVEALTPAELARHVVRTMKPDDRRRTISRSEGAFLVRRLMSDLDSETAVLLQAAAFPVWAAVQELRASGVAPSDVARAARRPHERVLAELHGRYEKFMSDHGLRDAADMILAAIELADRFASRRTPELVAVLDQVHIDEQEERLIRAISGAAAQSARIGTGRVDWPSDRAAAVFSDWPTVRNIPGDQEQHERASPAGPRPSITAGERREEVASVLADIIGRELAFDDVEIACTSADLYRSEIRAACRRYGIPVSETGLRRLAETRTGASVTAALRWVADGYPVDGIVSMLRLGYVQPSSGGAIDLAAVLDRFPVSLADAAQPAIRERLIERARHEYVNVGHLIDAFRMMDRIRKIVPSGAREEGAEVLRFVESFLREYGPHKAQRDEVASLILRELAFLGGSSPQTDSGEKSGFVDVEAAASFAVQVLERLSVNVGPDRGGLSVVRLEDAGHGRASHVYVVGLDDQSCAGRVTEDSLLTDSFRSRMREPDGRGPLAEQPIHAKVLLDDLEASRPGGVTRCRALYDIALDRPLFPGIAERDAAHVAETAAVRGPSVLDLTDSFLADSTNVTPALAGALFENIERGRLAAASRKMTSWTPFDGVVSEASDKLRQILPSTHSPSVLEDLAACPYRFFLRKVLRVPVHESQDPDEWMTARDRGQILHTLFERHARHRMSEGAVPSDERAWLAAEVRDLLDRFTATNPPPHDAFLQEAKTEIEAAGAVYLHAERENDDRKPHAAEFRFGADDDADAPPLMLTFDGDQTLSLTGRVDRIDLTNAGRLVVTDFKTGKRRGLTASDLRKLDKTLQWAIYARLVRHHFGREVEASGYLFTSAHELGLRREAAPPPDEDLDRLLGEMLARTRAGFFARNANPYGEPCSFCDFRSVCGDLQARRDEVRSKACASVDAGDHLAPLIETWNGFSPRHCS